MMSTKAIMCSARRPLSTLAIPPIRASRCITNAKRPFRIPTPSTIHFSPTTYRYASSTSTNYSFPSKSHLSVPARSPSSTLPTAQILAKLNPPSHTYAPPLSIPNKKPGQNSFKYLFQCGKLYIAFYKQGIRNVWATYKLAKELKAKQKNKAAGGGKDDLGILTRAEYQIVRRSSADILRLPGFAVLVLVFGEWMPLIALYITALIPEPCRIPKQVSRQVKKREKRRAERERRIGLDAFRLVAKDRKAGVSSPSVGIKGVDPARFGPKDVEKADYYTLLSLSTKLDIHSSIWDWLFISPPRALLKWGVRRKLEYLRHDDGLILRDGGVGGLSGHEILRACGERGIQVGEGDEEGGRRGLGAWLKEAR